MAVRDDWAPGEVLTSTDLNDTFASKLDLAGGKILQIVRATDSTNRSTTSTSLVDVTGMSVTITPQKSNSAIIVLSTFQFETASLTDDTFAAFAITDSSNNVISGGAGLHGSLDITGTGTRRTYGSRSIFGYSTPATTSATTYKLRFRVNAATTTLNIINASSTGQMYAIEVSA